MSSKVTKQSQIPLKFDTSLEKLACFIKTRQKKAVDKNKHKDDSQQNITIKKRSKSNYQQVYIFRKQDFIQSILIKTFTQEFACTDDIKKLVQNLALCQDQDCSSNNRFSAKQCKFTNNNNDFSLNQQDDYNAIIANWIENSKDNIYQLKTKIGMLQTPKKLLNLNKSATEVSPNLLSYQMGQSTLPYLYEQSYCSEQQFQEKQNLQRKKRNISNELSKEYRIQPQKIEGDGRTTLMIRNIPNKYTQQLLLEEFNKNFKVKFDFFYLPIDYNNSCNIGYAFINFTHAKFIYSFYNEFNGKKWNKFNSEKICSLTYARIQGTGALRNHFKNSHVMQQKDKGFRPLLSENDDGQKLIQQRTEEGQQQ